MSWKAWAGRNAASCRGNTKTGCRVNGSGLEKCPKGSGKGSLGAGDGSVLFLRADFGAPGCLRQSLLGKSWKCG